ncbi:hypothetical protein MRB53_036612 [Persea americana]|nr:hypothetical protein MRB53_037992 [Persea americana]KAJ8613934.1 hypothetical protein MRB53_036788 [Persea americana]KAJ8614372.1 hypothetical protein MRB53_036570 [Persea americana]KAJ8614414.1 hypothetical protein MRB53_036612 [Persea americana]
MAGRRRHLSMTSSVSILVPAVVEKFLPSHPSGGRIGLLRRSGSPPGSLTASSSPTIGMVREDPSTFPCYSDPAFTASDARFPPPASPSAASERISPFRCPYYSTFPGGVNQ